MTLQRIDEALAAWNRRLEAMAANLLWLQAESTYQCLTGSGGAQRIVLTGVTAAKVQPALSELPSLFQNFDLLHSTIGQAAELRKDMPMLFGSEQKLAEIEKLLFGRSIQLPMVDVPLAQRTLLGQSQSLASLSPEELLAPMESIFAAARDAVLSVERAWQELAAGIGRAESQLEAVQAAAGETAEATRALADLRDQVQSDPLGALEVLTARVQPAVARAEAAVARRVQAQREMESARQMWTRLQALEAEGAAVVAEARRKVADCAGLPDALEVRRVMQLGEWLARVERLLDSGALDASTGEMRNWRASAEDCIAQATKIVAASRAPLEARRELRGRLDALKAKARVRGVAERDDVAAIAKEAENLLTTRPTDLVRAADAVAEYAKRVNGGAERR